MDILIAQERELHKLESRKNEAITRLLLHPDFQETGASGTSYDLPGIVNMMQIEGPSQWQVHSQDFEYIPLSENVSLLLYKSCLVNEGQQPKDFAKRSSIWVKRGNNWQIQYHQGTPCEAFVLS